MISSMNFSINFNEDTKFLIESFETKLPELKQHSPVYLERLYNKLDSKVHKVSWITQNQMDKLTSVAFFVSAIAAASLNNIGLSSLLCFVSSYYAKSFYRYDLDSMSVRSRLQEKIVRWCFFNLANKFDFDDILEYDLLKKVTECYTTDQKVQIYADVKDLIDIREKMRIDIHQKCAKLNMQHPAYHVPDRIDMQHDNLLNDAYKRKMEVLMEVLIEERYRKILEGAYLKEDLN